MSRTAAVLVVAGAILVGWLHGLGDRAPLQAGVPGTPAGPQPIVTPALPGREPAVPLITEVGVLRSRVTQLEGQLRELETRLDQLRRDHDSLRTSYTRHTHGLAGLGTSGTFQDARGEGGAIATYGRTV